MNDRQLTVTKISFMLLVPDSHLSFVPNDDTEVVDDDHYNDPTNNDIILDD
jgi:hypothetical protein